MELRRALIGGVGGLAIASITRAWMSSLDFRAYFYQADLDPAHPAFRGPVIFLLWHEYIPFPFYLRGGCNIAMLLGRKLRWDPDNEDFVGDEQASKLVARPQRKPYTIEV